MAPARARPRTAPPSDAFEFTDTEASPQTPVSVRRRGKRSIFVTSPSAQTSQSISAQELPQEEERQKPEQQTSEHGEKDEKAEKIAEEEKVADTAKRTASPKKSLVKRSPRSVKKSGKKQERVGKESSAQRRLNVTAKRAAAGLRVSPRMRAALEKAAAGKDAEVMPVAGERTEQKSDSAAEIPKKMSERKALSISGETRSKEACDEKHEETLSTGNLKSDGENSSDLFSSSPKRETATTLTKHRSTAGGSGADPSARGESLDDNPSEIAQVADDLTRTGLVHRALNSTSSSAAGTDQVPAVDVTSGKQPEREPLKKVPVIASEADSTELHKKKEKAAEKGPALTVSKSAVSLPGNSPQKRRMDDLFSYDGSEEKAQEVKGSPTKKSRKSMSLPEIDKESDPMDFDSVPEIRPRRVKKSIFGSFSDKEKKTIAAGGKESANIAKSENAKTVLSSSIERNESMLIEESKTKVGKAMGTANVLEDKNILQTEPENVEDEQTRKDLLNVKENRDNDNINDSSLADDIGETRKDGTSGTASLDVAKPAEGKKQNIPVLEAAVGNTKITSGSVARAVENSSGAPLIASPAAVIQMPVAGSKMAAQNRSSNNAESNDGPTKMDAEVSQNSDTFRNQLDLAKNPYVESISKAEFNTTKALAKHVPEDAGNKLIKSDSESVKGAAPTSGSAPSAALSMFPLREASKSRVRVASRDPEPIPPASGARPPTGSTAPNKRRRVRFSAAALASGSGDRSGPRLGVISALRASRRGARRARPIAVDSFTNAPDPHRADRALLDQLQYLLDGVFQPVSDDRAHKLVASSLLELLRLLRASESQEIGSEKLTPTSQPTRQTLLPKLRGEPALLRKIAQGLVQLRASKPPVALLAMGVLLVLARCVPRGELFDEADIEALVDTFFSAIRPRASVGERVAKERQRQDQQAAQAQTMRRRMRSRTLRRLEASSQPLDAVAAVREVLMDEDVFAGVPIEAVADESEGAAVVAGCVLARALEGSEECRSAMVRNRRLDRVVSVLYKAMRETTSVSRSRESVSIRSATPSPPLEDGRAPQERARARTFSAVAMRVLEFATLHEENQRRVAVESKVCAVAIRSMRERVEARDVFSCEGLISSALKLCINLTHGCQRGLAQFIEACGIQVVVDCLALEGLSADEGKSYDSKDEQEAEEEGDDKNEMSRIRVNRSFDVRVLCLALLASIVDQDGEARADFQSIFPAFGIAREGGALAFILETLKNMSGDTGAEDSMNDSDEQDSSTEPHRSKTIRQRSPDVDTREDSYEQPSFSMEKKVTTGYLCLLIGALVRNCEKNRVLVKAAMPENSLLGLAAVLDEFLEFHHDIGVVSVGIDNMYDAIISSLREDGKTKCSTTEAHDTKETTATSQQSLNSSEDFLKEPITQPVAETT